MQKKAAREGFQANSAFCNLLFFFAWDDKLIKKEIDRESERDIFTKGERERLIQK